jgi:hypothetical protein
MKFGIPQIAGSLKLHISAPDGEEYMSHTSSSRARSAELVRALLATICFAVGAAGTSAHAASPDRDVEWAWPDAVASRASWFVADELHGTCVRVPWEAVRAVDSVLNSDGVNSQRGLGKSGPALAGYRGRREESTGANL